MIHICGTEKDNDFFLMYEDAAELTGATVQTGAGEITCPAGTIAMKAGMKNIKQLDGNGNWVDC